MGLFGRVWPRSISLRLPTLRFRANVMLGFAVVLAISAASMGIAYLGFERVSAGVASYRHSVSEADLARNIDRELISYRALARYYVVTGKEDDGKAALVAEASSITAWRNVGESEAMLFWILRDPRRADSA